MTHAERINTAAYARLRAIAESRGASFKPLLAAIGVAAALAAFNGDVLAQGAPGGPVPPPFKDPNANVLRHAKGRLLVQTRAGLSDRELDKIIGPQGGKRMRKLERLGIQVISLPDDADEITVANILKKNPHIKFAEIDRLVPHTQTTNDPSLPSEWHIPKINAPAAWDYTAGSGVTIAILDSGTDGTHPDLAAAMVPGWNMVNGNSDTRDVYGHGTQTAGTAAAIGNNGQGVAGVAWQAKIMPVRVSDSTGYAYWSTMASGITWAADNGARVANLSFQNTCGSATVANAAQYLRNKGGVAVIAAGNTSGQIADAPSSAVTCVSATDGNDNLTGWSSWGQAVDVAAPGAGIITTTVGGGYGSVSGTSFSAPITSAIYALMMAANPSLTPGQLDSILFSTATDLGSGGYDVYYGAGRVNAAAAVAKAKQSSTVDSTAPTVAVSGPTIGAKVRGLVPVDVAANDNVGVTKVELYVNGNLNVTDVASPFGFSWDTSGLADGPATLMARAYDAAGNATNSTGVSVTIANDTTPPTVTIANPLGGATVTGTVTVSVNGTDNNKVAKLTLTIGGKQVAVSYGPTLSYSWNTGSSSTTTTTTTTKGRGKSKTNTTTTTTSGSATISAQAEDPAGNVATTSATVNLQ
jgi:subtilisin family serine protease